VIRSDDVVHAVFASEPDENSLARQLRLGFDSAGRLLEIIVLHVDIGNELIIHAMNRRVDRPPGRSLC
jgi:hypothetical protein